MKQINDYKNNIKKKIQTKNTGLNFKSQVLKRKLRELNEEKENSSNDDSIIIDEDAKFVSFNFKMRDFERTINQNSNYPHLIK